MSRSEPGRPGVKPLPQASLIPFDDIEDIYESILMIEGTRRINAIRNAVNVTHPNRIGDNYLLNLSVSLHSRLPGTKLAILFCRTESFKVEGDS
jgi:hypothetical protein